MSKKFKFFCEESKKGASEIYSLIVDIKTGFAKGVKHIFAFALLGVPLFVWAYLLISHAITDIGIILMLFGIAMFINICWIKCISNPFMKCFLPDIADEF